MRTRIVIAGLAVVLIALAGLFVVFPSASVSAAAGTAAVGAADPARKPTKKPRHTPTPTATPTETATDTPTDTATTTPAPAGQCTDPVWVATGADDMQQFNGYFVHNNMWNAPAGGSQTISACSETSWFVEASNFPDNNYEVFSYPNVHLDMPNWPGGVPLSGLPQAVTSFAGSPQDKGNFNVAYDVWINGVGNGNGSTELMIWTDTRPQTLEPLGTDQGDLTISGVVYDVYHYNDGNVNVVSYKARSAVRSGTFDLKQIVGDGVSRGFIPADPKLSAVDYGVEYRFTDGTARFDVTDFSVSTS